MKKQTIVLALFLIVNIIQAQNPLQKQWDYRFGGTYNDQLYSFKQTSDGGYIFAGQSNSGIGGDKTQPNWDTIVPIAWDYWMVKVDSIGNKQWDKRFGGTNIDYFSCVQQTHDNGYILGGYSNSGIDGDKTQAPQGSYDYWIVKTDSLGKKKWDKRFGGSLQEYFFSLQQTSDRGYILGGWSDSGVSGDKSQSSRGLADYWIVKIDSLGNKLWDKRFGGNSNDLLASLQQTSDGGYILGGISYSGIGGDKTQQNWDITNQTADYWILKIDSLGIKQWDKRFGGTENEGFYSIKETANGEYILGGYSSSDISGDKTQSSWDTCSNCFHLDYWVVKIDSLGNKLWDKRFGGTAEDAIIEITLDTTENSYLLTGNSISNAGGDKTENNLGFVQTWLVKIDSIGNKIWDKTIFTMGDDYAFNTILHNKCYVTAIGTSAGIGGYKTQPSWGYNDYWMIKFCDTTSTTSINQISNSQIQISIYPNPANTLLNLFVNRKENIIITDILGKIVLQKNAEGKVQFDVSFLSAGIYFVRAGNEVRKFVKE